MRRVLVFGTFDRLHEGHKKFIEQAAEAGEELVACVSRDETVRTLKGRDPDQSMKERMNQLAKLDKVDKVIEGDLELGSYDCILNIKPGVIALGYDQDALQEDLRRWMKKTGTDIPLITIDPHKPEIYKTSLLRKYD